MPRGRFVNRPYEALSIKDYLLASSIATATATVIPTMGLLPAPMRPIISLDKPPLNQKSLDIIRMRHITVSAW